MPDPAANCGAEKMHTCLPEDETVEGHAHGPQVQSLGESEQRHHFRGLNTHVQPALEQTVNVKAVALIYSIYLFMLENMELPGA